MWFEIKDALWSRIRDDDHELTLNDLFKSSYSRFPPQVPWQGSENSLTLYVRISPNLIISNSFSLWYLLFNSNFVSLFVMILVTHNFVGYQLSNVLQNGSNYNALSCYRPKVNCVYCILISIQYHTDFVHANEPSLFKYCLASYHSWCNLFWLCLLIRSCSPFLSLFLQFNERWHLPIFHYSLNPVQS